MPSFPQQITLTHSITATISTAYSVWLVALVPLLDLLSVPSQELEAGHWELTPGQRLWVIHTHEAACGDTRCCTPLPRSYTVSGTHVPALDVEEEDTALGHCPPIR